MKIAYLTVSMPFGPSETFFIPEAKEIINQGHELVIIPRSPVGDILNDDAQSLKGHSIKVPFLSSRILFDGLIEFLRCPLRTISSPKVDNPYVISSSPGKEHSRCT